MKSCSACSQMPHLFEEGYLLLQSAEVSTMTKVQKVLKDAGRSFQYYEPSLEVHFQSKDEMRETLKHMDTSLSKEDKSKLNGTWSSKQKERFPNMAPFDQLLLRVDNPHYFQIINDAKFIHHMQPIIEVDEYEVFGYEFLVRPLDDAHKFHPGELFSYSSEAGLQTLLDSRARVSSISTGAAALPSGTKMFINFLPSSIYDPSHCLRTTFQAVTRYGVHPEDLIFEVVETEKIDDIEHLQKVFNVYKQYGVKVALDDLGSGYASEEVMQQLQPDYVKVDRDLVRDCDTDEVKQKRIESIVATAHQQGTKVLVEGIETHAELDTTKNAGVDYAQGFYIGRPAAEPLNNNKVAL
ncbi:EAL domain-containing protein (putative c-di-GMP-specific phosphodiesterase class I) [Salsuginibacillus halophilus]|uniref:EAL domain-containing protein (Putative c-di-GMP-specific phosphodiesterase class I) n=1 Tax=Salsuginibacillus halophilus TaxID=517424 RepID=A0A2P8HXT9_9BACI|nr:EAL domain-containing protein [Salsuginibacillus halophilus]PSL50965.1 EAL domain-containing protein (putative c-di-GMP-specific phosphodiesterase class I) [Salsuginibacillus halophilus]